MVKEAGSSRLGSKVHLWTLELSILGGQYVPYIDINPTITQVNVTSLSAHIEMLYQNSHKVHHTFIEWGHICSNKHIILNSVIFYLLYQILIFRTETQFQ